MDSGSKSDPLIKIEKEQKPNSLQQISLHPHERLHPSTRRHKSHLVHAPQRVKKSRKAIRQLDDIRSDKITGRERKNNESAGMAVSQAKVVEIDRKSR